MVVVVVLLLLVVVVATVVVVVLLVQPLPRLSQHQTCLAYDQESAGTSQSKRAARVTVTTCTFVTTTGGGVVDRTKARTAREGPVRTLLRR